MKLSDIQRMIDISAVRTDVTEQEIDELVAAAKRYHFLCAFAMPCYTRMLVEKLADTPDVLVGGVVGFPSGGGYDGNKSVHCKTDVQSGRTGA